MLLMPLKPPKTRPARWRLEEVQLEELSIMSELDRLHKMLATQYLNNNFEVVQNLCLQSVKRLEALHRLLTRARLIRAELTNTGETAQFKGFDYTRYDQDAY